MRTRSNSLISLAETVREIRELLRVGIDAFYEVLQVLFLLEHVVKAGLEQLLGQSATVINEDGHHLLQVFDVGIAVHTLDQLDTFSWHRHEWAHAACTATHQNQLAYALWVIQGECDSGVATHGITNQMDAIQAQRVDEAFERISVDVRARAST